MREIRSCLATRTSHSFFLLHLKGKGKDMRMCSICKREEQSLVWQPELESFYTPGSHQRGFIALAIGEQCKQKLERGESLLVTYKRRQYMASIKGLWQGIS